jgi:hypothetical protein
VNSVLGINTVHILIIETSYMVRRDLVLIERLKCDVSGGVVYSLLFRDFLTLEDGTDRLFRNVGKGLPLDAA